MVLISIYIPIGINGTNPWVTAIIFPIIYILVDITGSLMLPFIWTQLYLVDNALMQIFT